MSRGRVSRQNAIYASQSTGQFGPRTEAPWVNRHVYNRSVELDDYVVPPRVPKSKLDTGKPCVPQLANTEYAVSKTDIIDNIVEAGRAHVLKSDVNRNRNTNVDIIKRDNSKSDYTDSEDKHVKRIDVNRRGNANNSDKTIGDGDLANHSNNSSKFVDHMHMLNSSSIPRNTVPGRYTDLVYSDADSSIMSAYDRSQYSQQLKEFENMVKTCTDNGEYVYLSQINELRNKGLNTTNRAFHLDNDNESFEKRDALNDSGYLDNGIDIPGWQPNVPGIGYSDVDITGYNADTSGNIVTNSEVEYSYPLKRPKEMKDPSKGNLDKAARNIPNVLDVEHRVNVEGAHDIEVINGGINSKRKDGYSDDFKPTIVVTDHSEVSMPGITVDAKKDRNDNVLETSSESTVGSVDNGHDNDHQGDNEEDLKKIIQECLWYFHSQVETNRAKGQTAHTKSKSMSDSQKQYIQIDRRYRPLGHARGVRPRSLTDLDEQQGGYDRLRPRSMTDTDLTVANTQAMSNGWIDANKGEGLSVVADVSSVSSQHGSPHHSPRVHTLPPRVPTSRSTNPDIRIDRRETSSLRRRPNLARRSKSAFNMSMTSSEPYAYPHTQHEQISTGRMFIEDVLSDIRQQRSSTGPDIYQPRIGAGLESSNMNTNEIKTCSASDNGRVPLVTNHVVSCPPPRGSTEFKSLKSTKLNVTSTNTPVHFKSRSGDSSSSKTIPNLTKNSNFIRSLSQNSILSNVTPTSLIQKSEISSNDKSENSKSESLTSSSSSTNSLGVFDIVGEDSGCRYPWQRDATTQYDPPELEIGSETGTETKKEETNLDSKLEQTSEIQKNQEDMKLFEGIIKRQRNFRAKRPHSMGCIDTSSLDANLAGIAEIQNSARSRLSEPLLQSGSFIRKRSSNLSDESGSSVNLESIQENPAELTLRNSVHRNVLSSPSVSPEMWRDAPNRNGAASDLDDSDGQVFESPVGRRKKPTRHRSTGSVTSGSEDSDHEPSQPLARRGRRSAIVDTKNCGDVSPTTLSPEASPSNSSDEGEIASGRQGRRLSSVNNGQLNVYPGDLLVQEHHKKLIKRNTIADFYSGRNGSTPNLTDDNKKQRQPFSLLKLMKTRSKESLAQLSDVLQTLKPTEFKDNNLAAYKNVHWTDLIASTDKQGTNNELMHISPMERKRRESVWELFKSECVFLIDHLMVLKNCFLEPLKKLQVEGFLMYTEPSEIFSNLEELCYVSYTFCKDFIGSLVKDMSATDFGRTSVLIKALQRFSAHSKDGSVYHTYCLNYSNALTYLEKLRKNDDFCEFEKWCEQDLRCNRLQLADLLIGPMQHCTKLPLLLHNIKKYTEDPLEKRQVAESIDKVESSLEQLEDKMKWLKNFERVQEIQRQLVWPTVTDLDPRAFIPDNLKSKLLRQPCARLLACPTRQLLYEGTITLTETTKTIDAYMFLFDDILLLAKMKKRKKQSTGENLTAPLTDTYTVHRQPLALDRLVIHDLSTQEAAASGIKHGFVLVQISRFQQIIDVFTLQAASETAKNSWLTKIKNAKAQYHSVSRANSLKEDVETNSLHGKPYHGKSKSIDTTILM